MNTHIDLITVTIKLFAIYQEVYQKSEINLTIPANSKAQDILSIMSKEKPLLKSWINITKIAVNLEIVNPDYLLHNGDEIALIPPVSGG
ncbi:MoaD/ThiS family protein [Geminocystis sp. CENA526]|uniref:MoaD/ThiS family protein n=1 Tax=Geminocystis sp. CENA526 TaxID=1355871 RepID=UPI003D6E9956